ncbi:MAG: alpha-ribazole phosphatase family protein [Chitinophagales bacterium]|nr:alpha-ribazole phosphatase family protein [Chitinophagales bacterium]MDW8273238.1 alpha-ribazole phosphatase family protein [Chitinophagales bacterium]
MEIHVLRHTRIAAEGICYGQLDLPPAASFAEEALALASQLDNDYSVVYSSPLTRCMMLAHQLGYENVQTDKRLLELNFGEWEGKPWTEINQYELQRWMNDYVQIEPKGGENLNEMYSRVKSFLDELSVQDKGKALVITHAGVIRCCWAYLLHVPLQHIFKIPVGYNEVFAFRLQSDSCWNSILRKQ